MYAGDGNLTASGRFANFSAPRAIDLRHRICQREWRDLDAVVADSSGVRKDVFDLPAFEDFVANGEAHGSQSQDFARSVQGECGWPCVPRCRTEFFGASARISLTPRFSGVNRAPRRRNRFNGFSPCFTALRGTPPRQYMHAYIFCYPDSLA